MKFTHVGMTDNEGLEFGLDAVTPVTWRFYKREPTSIRYHWTLPKQIVDDLHFQQFARNQRELCLSYKELQKRISSYGPQPAR